MGGATAVAGAMSPVSLLRPERTAILVVDLQEKLLPAISEKERVLRNSLLLLRLARILDLPVLLTTQYKKGLGQTVPEVLAVAPGVPVFDKVAFGCFGSDEFRARLDALGRDQLVVSGIESHICVAQTVLGALERNLEVHVASDAVGSRSEDNRLVGLERMRTAGATLSSAEMAAYELLSRSDGEAFKAMLPHLKG